MNKLYSLFNIRLLHGRKFCGYLQTVWNVTLLFSGNCSRFTVNCMKVGTQTLEAKNVMRESLRTHQINIKVISRVRPSPQKNTTRLPLGCGWGWLNGSTYLHVLSYCQLPFTIFWISVLEVLALRNTSTLQRTDQQIVFTYDRNKSKFISKCYKI